MGISKEWLLLYKSIKPEQVITHSRRDRSVILLVNGLYLIHTSSGSAAHLWDFYTCILPSLTKQAALTAVTPEDLYLEVLRCEAPPSSRDQHRLRGRWKEERGRGKSSESQEYSLNYFWNKQHTLWDERCQLNSLENHYVYLFGHVHASSSSARSQEPGVHRAAAVF